MRPPTLPQARHRAGRRTGWISAGAGVVAAVAALAVVPAARTAETGTLRYARQDPMKIVTSQACGECHLSARQVWAETAHATGFDTLHREERAQTIAGKMGFRLLKRDSLCLTCHYTAQLDGGELRAVEGVSCEACHGAGRDWIKVHNDYGEGYDHTTEPPEHRRRRIAASRAAGMRRPSDDLYSVAASCYGCHTVPNEELVNVGGHPTGTAGFELVAWQEKIRHNFLASFVSGDGTENRERTLPEKRTMYVLGRYLDLAFSLRAMAAATEPGIYAQAKSRSVRIALSEVQEIAARASLPGAEAMVAQVRGVSVVPGNGEALMAAAGKVGELAQGFMADHDPAKLASLDPLVLGIEEPEPETPAAVAEAETGSEPQGGPAAGAGAPETGGGEPGGGAPGATPTPGSSSQAGATGAVPAEGAFKRRVHPASQHATLGPGACSGCHEAQNKWWFADAHYHSADPFFNRERRNLQIARFYGLSTPEMTRGNQVCMDCHGTPITGKESRDVFDGVSCESCHGPSKDYLEPHKPGDKSLGDQRPGYLDGLRLGLVKLEDLGVRARTCTGCHYITEPRLLSSGHPSGEGFDFVAAMAKVRHWEDPPAAAGEIRAAFSAALAARGAVPQVRMASLGETGGGSVPEADAGAGAGADRGSSGEGGTGRAAGRRVVRTLPPTPRPVARHPTSGAAAAPVELPPFPEIDDSTPVEEVLVILQRRLKLLYESVQERP